MSGKTEFDKKYIGMVDKYLDTCKDEDYVFQKTQGVKSDSFEEKTRVKLPTIEGFASFVGVERKTLYNWKTTFPEFDAALDKIRDEQLKRLINRGLEGTYNSTIAKLMLSHNHGMRDNTDITTDGEKINTFSDEQINRIAERIARGNAGNGDSTG